MDIKYNFLDIEVEEFSFLRDEYDEDQGIELGINAEISSYLNHEEDTSMLKCELFLKLEQNDKDVLDIVSANFFTITVDSWEKVSETEYKLPLNFISHLLLLSVSTLRGIVFEKTTEEDCRGVVLPSIDITGLVEDDYIADE